MATQYTAGLTAGDTLTAATMNSIGAAWQTYTPAWTGTTTNPAIGNGTIQGIYAQIQKIVFVLVNILPGSTTTYGSGTYGFSVPITRSANAYMGGVAQILDASAGFINYMGPGQWASTTVVEYRLGNATGVFSPTVPITMGTSDQFRMFITYEAA